MQSLDADSVIIGGIVTLFFTVLAGLILNKFNNRKKNPKIYFIKGSIKLGFPTTTGVLQNAGDKHSVVKINVYATKMDKDIGFTPLGSNQINIEPNSQTDFEVNLGYAPTENAKIIVAFQYFIEKNKWSKEELAEVWDYQPIY